MENRMSSSKRNNSVLKSNNLTINCKWLIRDLATHSRYGHEQQAAAQHLYQLTYKCLRENKLP